MCVGHENRTRKMRWGLVRRNHRGTEGGEEMIRGYDNAGYRGKRWIVIYIDMKKRVLAVCCAVAIGLLPINFARAQSPTDVAADAIIVRPVTFATMLAGSVAFVLTLPFTAPAGGVHSAAHALVIVPAKMTFHRKMGDLETLSESDE